MGGYLGLGPFTGIDKLESNHLNHDEVLLYELKDKNHIDHETVAFYVSSSSNHLSMIKFGSYDPEGFKDPSDMGIFSTVWYNTWAIEASGTYTLKDRSGKTLQAEFHDSDVQTGNFMVDPGLPFFYVPATYFQKIIDTFANGAVTYQDAEFSFDRIRFNTKCYEVNPGV